MNKGQAREYIDLIELLQQIKKHLYIFIISMIAAGFVGLVISSYFITPEYEAAVTMIVNTKQDNSTTVTNDNITSAQNLVATYSIIIKSNVVLNQVIDNLNLDMRYEDLEDIVSVDAVNDTQIMRVSVRHPDAALAGKIVEQIAAVAPDIIVDTVEAGSCKVISQVMTDSDPISPNVKRNTALASILGLMVSAIAVVLRLMTKEKNVIDDDDVQKYLDLPVLGVIPEVEDGNR